MKANGKSLVPKFFQFAKLHINRQIMDVIHIEIFPASYIISRSELNLKSSTDNSDEGVAIIGRLYNNEITYTSHKIIHNRMNNKNTYHKG